MEEWYRKALDQFDFTRNLRRDLHRHPELGFQEVRTAGIVARELTELGLEVTTGIGQTGVVALLEGEQPGPVILLRFDMDALPIQEQTGASYASQNPGVMHACGHDGHTAIGLTVARLLNAERPRLSGSVKFVFQPAEEGLGGAQSLVAAGILEHPKPDFSLALHLWNEFPLDRYGISPGPVMAAAEIFHLKVTGKGGHAAIPNLAVDPLVAAAQIISAAQSIVSREVSPLQSAVISFTSLQAGETFNVIPADARLQGTIRTYDPQVRDRVLRRFRQLVAGVGEAMNCQVELNLESLTPAVTNNPQLAERMAGLAERVLPPGEINRNYRTMGSEDMAFLMQTIPGCFVFVGSANHEQGLDAGHHHPRFDFDESALVRGTALLAAAASDLLK
jgi:amidohydrolase